MLTNSLPINATSSFKTGPSLLPLANFPLSIGAGRRHVERADRNQAHPPRHRVAANMVYPVVEISPPDSVERRTASWPGMAAEIVQVTRSNRIESRFCAAVHLLAVYERGMRQEGETFIEALPRSTLRDFRRKLVFVPAGHRYRDWQEPRIRTRVAYFYFDPAAFAINADLSVTELPFSPRLYFEDNGLWDVALKLTTSIEGDGSVHRPYVEALGVLMAHELIRLHTASLSYQSTHRARQGLVGKARTVGDRNRIHHGIQRGKLVHCCISQGDRADTVVLSQELGLECRLAGPMLDCSPARSERNVNQAATFVRRWRVPTNGETNVSPIDPDLHGRAFLLLPDHGGGVLSARRQHQSSQYARCITRRRSRISESRPLAWARVLAAWAGN
jgi:hypothetical protein